MDQMSVEAQVAGAQIGGFGDVVKSFAEDVDAANELLEFARLVRETDCSVQMRLDGNGLHLWIDTGSGLEAVDAVKMLSNMAPAMRSTLAAFVAGVTGLGCALPQMAFRSSALHTDATFDIPEGQQLSEEVDTAPERPQVVGEGPVDWLVFDGDSLLGSAKTIMAGEAIEEVLGTLRLDIDPASCHAVPEYEEDDSAPIPQR